MTGKWIGEAVAAVGLLAGLTTVAFADEPMPQCLHVSSYHAGNEWNDGIERALKKVLAGRCELRHFYMDTRRHESEQWGKQRAQAAYALIQEWAPEVVIASDDSAIRYLVRPYLRDRDQQVVFCGINWTASEYGIPYSNTTGMTEVAPIRPLLKQIRRIDPDVRKGIYVGGNTRAEHKDFERYRDVYERYDVHMEAVFVTSMRSWMQAYERGQDYDFIILGDVSAIPDWEPAEARRFAMGRAGVLTVTNYRWMMPYSAFALTKIPEEQGEWAGKTALAILDGLRPKDIPVVANRRWDMWVNEGLLRRMNIKLPRNVLAKANRYQ